MSGAPWLSVIMPTFNGGRWVTDALESVRRQEPDGVEVLVVDDGSTDATLEVVRSFAATMDLRTVPHEPCGNWVRATNTGLRAARGRHACFLHQDDLWLAGRLTAVRRAIAQDDRGARLVVHPARFVGPDGESLGPWHCPLGAGQVDGAELMEQLLVQNFIAIPSPVFEVDLALRTGGLDESLWYTADWDLWLRLAAAGPARFIDEPLAAFRVHPGSQTAARGTSFDELLQQMTTVFERHLPAWPVQGRRRRRVERAARFSARLNAALAATWRAQASTSPLGLAAEFVALGPDGWRRYLRASRLVERAGARLRLRMRPSA